MTLMEEIQAAFPDAKIGHHSSDLYVADPDRKIAAWLKMCHPDVEFKRFTANKDTMGEGEVSCIELNFKYDPFWEEVAKKSKEREGE